MCRIWINLLCLLLIGSVHGQVNFIAQTDARQSLVGSPFNVEFRLNNAEGSNFQEPDFGGLKKIGGPSRSMSTTVINGSMSSSIGYVYAVVGTTPGKYTIGPAKIVVGGKVIKTVPISVEIIKSTSHSNNSSPEGEVFIKVIVDQNEVYVGQQFMVTYKLYTQIGIDQVEALKNDIPAHCEIEYFATEYPAQREIIKGKEYTTKIISQYALFPTTSGNVELNARSYRLLMSQDDPFGFNMKSMFYSTAKVIESNGETIRVLELPSPKPDNFSGAVGNFDIKFSKLSPSYNLSDAINIQLIIEGNGNFNHINPQINLKDTLFDFLEPSSTAPVKISENNQIIKSQAFDFLLTPKSAGTFHFTPSFCFFDPQIKKYVQHKDSFSLFIKNSRVLLPGKESEFRPIHSTYDLIRKYRFANYVPYLLLLFPFLFALILFWKQWIAKLTWLEKYRSYSSKSAQDISLYDNNLEDLILMVSKKLFPQTIECTNLYQLKEFLLEQQYSTSANKLLEILNQYQLLKYNPSSNKQENQEIKKRLLELLKI